jgi:hypothetical protein
MTRHILFASLVLAACRPAETSRTDRPATDSTVISAAIRPFIGDTDPDFRARVPAVIPESLATIDGITFSADSAALRRAWGAPDSLTTREGEGAAGVPIVTWHYSSRLATTYLGSVTSLHCHVDPCSLAGRVHLGDPLDSVRAVLGPGYLVDSYGQSALLFHTRLSGAWVDLAFKKGRLAAITMLLPDD